MNFSDRWLASLHGWWIPKQSKSRRKKIEGFFIIKTPSCYHQDRIFTTQQFISGSPAILIVITKNRRLCVLSLRYSLPFAETGYDILLILTIENYIKNFNYIYYGLISYFPVILFDRYHSI